MAASASPRHGGQSDVDDTAAVVQALVEAGAQQSARDHRARSPSSCAPRTSTAASRRRRRRIERPVDRLGDQGLIAAGRDASSASRTAAARPLGYLESLLAPDGSVRYSRTSTQTPVWVTAQALTALRAVPPPSPMRDPSSRSAGLEPIAS